MMDKIFDIVRWLPGFLLESPWGIVLVLIVFALGLAFVLTTVFGDRRVSKAHRINEINDNITKWR